MIHDRGMIKWLPFKSLPEQESFLALHRARRECESCPELSPDQLAELNATLKQLEPGDRIEITVFEDGHSHRFNTNFLGTSGHGIKTTAATFDSKTIIELKRI